MVTKLIEAKTVLFDVGINHLSLQNTDRGLFIGNAALTTLAHVDFDIKNDSDQYTGKYSTEVAGDVVDLSGFKKLRLIVLIQTLRRARREMMRTAMAI